MYGTTSLEISRLHRKDLLREARAERLARTVRTARAGRSPSEGSAFLRPFPTPLLPLGVLLFLAVTALASSHAVFPLFPALLVALFLSVRRFERVGARRAVPGVVGPTDGPSVLPYGEVGRERELLLTLEHHGEITAARAALETSMGVAETEAMLDKLATNGHVRVIAREGTLAYALWE